MFRHHRAMDIAGIGHHDFTFNQLRKHQLVNGGRGGVDPFQLARRCELVRPDRPANQNICIANLPGQQVVTGQVDKIYLWEVTREPVTKPRRGTPEFKAMVMTDQNLHLLTNGFLKSWPVISLGCSKPSIPKTVGEMS